ncbi:hypothetical protein Pelo_14848 [Pelomyxa schiedti]|nr:hypothetical protein Pelo_14848 [Pelomyxa schiedti]
MSTGNTTDNVPTTTCVKREETPPGPIGTPAADVPLAAVTDATTMSSTPITVPPPPPIALESTTPTTTTTTTTTTSGAVVAGESGGDGANGNNSGGTGSKRRSSVPCHRCKNDHLLVPYTWDELLEERDEYRDGMECSVCFSHISRNRVEVPTVLHCTPCDFSLCAACSKPGNKPATPPATPKHSKSSNTSFEAVTETVNDTPRRRKHKKDSSKPSRSERVKSPPEKRSRASRQSACAQRTSGDVIQIQDTIKREIEQEFDTMAKTVKKKLEEKKRELVSQVSSNSQLSFDPFGKLNTCDGVRKQKLLSIKDRFYAVMDETLALFSIHRGVHLFDIPVMILKQIIEYLPDDCLQKVRTVCRTLRHIVHNVVACTVSGSILIGNIRNSIKDPVHNAPTVRTLTGGLVSRTMDFTLRASFKKSKGVLVTIWIKEKKLYVSDKKVTFSFQRSSECPEVLLTKNKHFQRSHLATLAAENAGYGWFLSLPLIADRDAFVVVYTIQDTSIGQGGSYMKH